MCQALDQGLEIQPQTKQSSRWNPYSSRRQLVNKQTTKYILGEVELSALKENKTCKGKKHGGGAYMSCLLYLWQPGVGHGKAEGHTGSGINTLNLKDTLRIEIETNLPKWKRAKRAGTSLFGLL